MDGLRGLRAQEIKDRYCETIGFAIVSTLLTLNQINDTFSKDAILSLCAAFLFKLLPTFYELSFVDPPSHLANKLKLDIFLFISLNLLLVLEDIISKVVLVVIDIVIILVAYHKMHRVRQEGI